MLEVRSLGRAHLHGERSAILFRWLVDRGADEFGVQVMAIRFHPDGFHPPVGHRSRRARRGERAGW